MQFILCSTARPPQWGPGGTFAHGIRISGLVASSGPLYIYVKYMLLFLPDPGLAHFGTMRKWWLDLMTLIRDLLGRGRALHIS